MVSKNVKQKIIQSEKGKLFFISDFSDCGNYNTVRKSLQRLVDKKLILRISRGIYYYPEIDETFGILYPSTDEIAKAIAKRDRARIIPTGSYALHLLGLSGQIPMNVVYLTDGSPRKIKIGNQKITLKKISPKNLNNENYLSSLIIQALKSKKEHEITHREKQILKDIISKSNKKEEIKKDISNAPVWIREIILEILTQTTNELA